MYRIIIDDTKERDVDEFEKKVSSYLALGWETAGGVTSVRSPSGHTLWAQAIIWKKKG